MCAEPCVEKIHSRSLDHSLQGVVGVGLDQCHNPRGHQNRKPLLCGWCGYSDLRRRGFVVYVGSCPRRYDRHEIQKCCLVNDLRYILDVSADVCLQIGFIVLLPIHLLVFIEARHGAFVDAPRAYRKNRSVASAFSLPKNQEPNCRPCRSIKTPFILDKLHLVFGKAANLSKARAGRFCSA